MARVNYTLRTFQKVGNTLPYALLWLPFVYKYYKIVSTFISWFFCTPTLFFNFFHVRRASSLKILKIMGLIQKYLVGD